MSIDFNAPVRVIKKDSVNWTEEICPVKSDFENEFVPLIPEDEFEDESDAGSQADIDAMMNAMSGGNANVEKEKEEEEKEKQIKLREQEYINSLRSEEYKRGLEEGKKTTLNQLEAEYNNKTEETMKNFSVILVDLKNEFAEYKNKIDEEVLKLSIAIAKKIVKREVILDNKILINQVKDSIRKVIGVDNIIIHINPNDEKIIKQYKPDLQNIFESLKEITIQSNERIEPGSCKIESSIGNVDARFATQMEIIENALMDELKGLRQAQGTFDP
jgi:flagellar assembly protein FliH